MLEQDLKKLFLIEFTKELIKNSYKQKSSKLFEEIKIPEEKRVIEVNEIPGKIKTENIPEAKPLIKELQITEPPVEKIPPVISIPRRVIPNVLRIPEPRLPETFSYLKPLPTAVSIDLGKLNPLIKDSNVRLIECDAPDENIIVEGNMGRKPTGIILNQEEVTDIINRFSEKAKIPINTGIYRVVIGRLLFLAIISEVLNSKFVIRKI
ncbi:MAG TPA: hypothetical protein VMC80_02315 [Patescibacteria group bacterium]|nr:hypothetical protein [Patescibacteria group bacterium]